MRAVLLLPCLLFVACNNPVEPGDAAYLGGRAPADYQLRITGACPAGQFAQSVGPDGTITCAVPDMSAADIVSVTTGSGSGLVGGAASGDVSLALAVCPAGQLLKNDGTGWACAPDADLLAGKTCTLGQVLHFDGTTWSCAGDADLLASTTCAAGQVLRFDGTSWGCAADADLLAGKTCAVGQVLHFDGTAWSCAGDADSFASRACPSGQVLKSSGAGWACAPDDDTPLPSCGQGQVLKSSGTGWLCANDDTQSSIPCPSGQVLKSNGAGYVCAPDDGLLTITTAAGSGLTGGGSTSALTLALAPCADGQVLKGTDGGWACAADTVGLTAVTTAANGGLTGGASALSLTGCAAGEVLKSNGTGWACAPDTGLTAITPRTGGGIVGGATTLSLMGCAAGEVLKSTASGDWVCGADDNAGGDLTSIVTPSTGGLVGGVGSGDATLTLADCPVGQVLKSTGTNSWACQADANAGGDITGVTASTAGGLIGGGASGDVQLALRACSLNEILKFNGTAWVCAADANSGDLTSIVTPATGGLVGGVASGDSTLTLTNCPVGQILKSTGTNTWSCQLDANAGGDMTGVITPASGGLVGGATSGDSTLTLANCPPGTILKSTGTNTWGCAFDLNAGGDITGVITAAGSGLAGGATSGDSTLTLTPCTLDQVLRFDGTGWSCAAYTAPYTAAAGITITGGAIAAAFTTPGSEAGTGTTVARGDHVHDTRYQPLFAHTVVVRSSGTAAQNGAALLAAIAGITTASATNRYLIKLEPGEFDLGTSGYSGKSYVDLEGSGRGGTLVHGTPNGPVINMAAESEVRELTAFHPGGTQFSIALQLTTGAAGPVIARRVAANADSGTFRTFGVNMTGTNVARLEDSQVAIDVTAGMGIAGNGNGTQPYIRRCTFVVTGTTGATAGTYGVNFLGSTLVMENNKIVTSSASYAVGIYAGNATAPQMTISDLEVSYTAGAATSRALDIRGGTLSLRNATISTSTTVAGMRTVDTELSMRDVEVKTTDAPALLVGHAALGVTRKITIENSVLDSNAVPAIFFEAVPMGGAGVENVLVASTRIDSTWGGALAATAGSTLKCWASYNENFDGLNAGCN